jgi:fatty-acid desaturase
MPVLFFLVQVQSISLAENQLQSLQATPHVDQNSGHHIPGAHKSVAIQKPTNFVFQAQHTLTHHPSVAWWPSKHIWIY